MSTHRTDLKRISQLNLARLLRRLQLFSAAVTRVFRATSHVHVATPNKPDKTIRASIGGPGHNDAGTCFVILILPQLISVALGDERAIKRVTQHCTSACKLYLFWSTTESVRPGTHGFYWQRYKRQPIKINHHELKTRTERKEK